MASYAYTFTSGDTVTPTKLNNARTVSEIVNADVSATAAIAGTKVAPNFGSQNVVTTGSAGFGTTSPTTLLHLRGSNALPPHLLLERGSGGADESSLRLVRGTNEELRIVAAAGGTFSGTNNAYAIDIIGNPNTRPLLVRTSTDNGATFTERMRIDASGNVGIGTTSPFTVLSTAKTITGGNPATSGSTDDNVIARFAGGVVAFDIGGTAGGAQWIQPRAFNNFATNYNLLICPNGGSLAVGTTSPSAAAKLDVASTTQGFLPPRMTTAQRDAISTPPAGLVIYNTSTNVLNFYNGSAWGAV